MSKRIVNISPQLCSTKIAVTEDVSDVRERIQAHVSRRSASGIPAQSPEGLRRPVGVQQRRPYSQWGFTNGDPIAGSVHLNAAAIPITSQENIILSELLYTFIGIRGTYIVPEFQEDVLVGFKISDQIHDTLREIIRDILPLAVYYSQIQRFVQQMDDLESGPVLQALSAALNELLHDYYMSVVQLETDLQKENLTLHKVLFFTRPTMASMEVIAKALKAISDENIRGGEVLTLLSDRIANLTGDSAARATFINLAQKAAVPYMEALQAWIYKGVVSDPHNEFLIEDTEVVSKGLHDDYTMNYWEVRYIVRRERIPRFLENLSDIILRTGKYLNVIRQCGKTIAPPRAESLVYTHANQNHVVLINEAYNFASRTLLDVLMKENDLMGHLQSMKKYFLLQQGDFIMQFMDACEEELSKKIDAVQPVKLENLLGLTLRLSSARNDPYKEDLTMTLLSVDLFTQMSRLTNKDCSELDDSVDNHDLIGLESFAFQYSVKWPVSLILNPFIICKYQMLFRQLFYCKHVERQLCKVWKSNKTAKKFAPEAAELYRSAFTLRQRMMNAIQNISYYMMVEVIEPNWHVLNQNMATVENVDDVLRVHEIFLDSCLKDCMLINTDMLKSITRLMKICTQFCDFIQKSQRYFIDAELTSMLKSFGGNDHSDWEYEMAASQPSQAESSMEPSETFSENVKRFDLEFTGLLIGLIKYIYDLPNDNAADKLINLVHRINFNSFYSDQLILCAKDSMGPSPK
ncbi:gamma-tubulin complex component 2 homolog isoform X2 [Lutzomyia longipalpis]|uniref:gamma-tubulin complex component 2 homolog isoform X2 n=1 Tax=Lutzomyia longipalpis TaxID=7200 RepID=UPI0024837612|nr:gamma-tubulin complex component 2 homolog isoform X2 [Lutzomyia longipalpis]